MAMNWVSSVAEHLKEESTTVLLLKTLLFSVHVSFFLQQQQYTICILLILILNYPLADEGAPCISGQIRLSNNGTINNQSGLVEVCVGGRWTTICSGNFFDDAGAQVICRQLGYSNPQSQYLSQSSILWSWVAIYVVAHFFFFATGQMPYMLLIPIFRGAAKFS